MNVQHVKNCIFSNWYPTFKENTIKSEIIPLSSEVVQYLLSDGIVLPESANYGPSYKKKHNPKDRWDIDSDSDDSVDWDSETTQSTAQTPHFPEFEKKVKDAISKLGGRVFPKLNWSAPRDATWVATGNTLECSNIGDILLLIKSSDFTTHDLTQPFINCVDCGQDDDQPDVNYELVLRKWNEISPGLEYRCFVFNRKLIGISQRHHSVFYRFIPENGDKIIADVKRFFNDHLRKRFPDDNYVFDIYREDTRNVTLVDFNPFGETTDSLLFTWDELRDIGEQIENTKIPEFRCIEEEIGVQPNDYHNYGMPKDFVDLSHGEDPFKLMDFLNLKDKVQQDDSSSDDDDS